MISLTLLYHYCRGKAMKAEKLLGKTYGRCNYLFLVKQA